MPPTPPITDHAVAHARRGFTRLRRGFTRLRRGFTLIEILIVIGILALLAATVIVAINPSKQLANARNAQRLENINAILNAYFQFAIENTSSFQSLTTPPVADCAMPLSPAPARKLCTAAMTPVTCDFGAPGDGEGCVYTGDLLPKYLADIPSDPKDVSGGNDDLQVDYSVLISQDGAHLTVFAPNTESPAPSTLLSVTR